MFSGFVLVFPLPPYNKSIAHTEQHSKCLPAERGVACVRLRERRRDRAQIPIEAVKKQLESIARGGRFKAVLLATEEGFDVVETKSDLDAGSLAALAGMVWDMNNNTRDITSAYQIDHIVMSGKTGDSVICQFFELLDQPVALIVVSENASVHRDLTDRAVEGIKRILE